ncbi:glycoside hydrolase family 43 protein [Polluticoccus soli]
MTTKTIILVLMLLGSTQCYSQYFRNPIISGFYPDPAICKAGSDYYIVNSSFAYFPGLPIFHSRDLANWQLLGYALDRPEQLVLNGAPISGGLYAPDIQYHDGTFYIVCTNVSNIGNFVITAKNPKGPWSHPQKLPEINGIDPSLFFDGDSAYIVYNSIAPNDKPIYEGHRTIRLIPFSFHTLSTTGDNRIIVNGGTDIAQKPVWIEGPHLFKEKDWYYLICAQNGTGYNHSEVVFRTRNLNEPFVPYDQNPILTQAHLDRNRPNPVTSTGHASFVKDNAGNWWSVFLGCRPYDSLDDYNTGRETFMAPVRWKNEWPIVDLKGEEVQYAYPIDAKRNPEYQVWNGNYVFKDDFSKKELNLRYAFLRVPQTNWYSLSNRKGCLTMDLGLETCEKAGNPSFVGFRQAHLKGFATARLVFNPVGENEKAGLLVFQNETHYYFICKSIKKGQPIVSLWKSSMDRDANTSKKPAILVATMPLHNATSAVELKIEADKNVYSFYFKEDGYSWKTLRSNLDARLLSTRNAGGFVGCFYAMYATANGQLSGTKAYFDSFECVNRDDVYLKTNNKEN